MSPTLDSKTAVTLLKAAAEPTRLRILLLLTQGQFNVKDLTLILGQSQPRISRHLKLLAEAGLIERMREGSWAYFHLSERTPAGILGRQLIDAIDRNDRSVERDTARADRLKQDRFENAQVFFKDHAAQWDQIRSMHVAEDDVEAAIKTTLGEGPFRFLVDLGTGTGRILELLSHRYDHAIGIDASQAMLSYARAKLDRGGLRRAQVRLGDMCNLAIDDHSADAVIMHQVLHFLADPARAIAEAARILAPNGRLLVIDFAPHEMEFLRDTSAHQRLGFTRDEVAQAMADAGLKLTAAIDLVPPPSAGQGKLTVSLWLAVHAGRRRLATAAVGDFATAGEQTS